MVILQIKLWGGSTLVCFMAQAVYTKDVTG